MILLVIWVVLMILWLFGAGYINQDNRNALIGNTIIPWVCVLILGIFVFGGYGPVIVNR